MKGNPVTIYFNYNRLKLLYTINHQQAFLIQLSQYIFILCEIGSEQTRLKIQRN